MYRQNMSVFKKTWTHFICYPWRNWSNKGLNTRLCFFMVLFKILHRLNILINNKRRDKDLGVVETRQHCRTTDPIKTLHILMSELFSNLCPCPQNTQPETEQTLCWERLCCHNHTLFALLWIKNRWATGSSVQIKTVACFYLQQL